MILNYSCKEQLCRGRTFPCGYYDVRILSPDENVTRTPSNEPLRFVTLIKPKKADKTFKEITLETKTKEKNKDVTLSKRSPEKFFVDYNAGNEAFEYQSLLTKHPKQNGGKWMLVPDLLLKVLKRLLNFLNIPSLNQLKQLMITVTWKHGKVRL